MSKPGPKPDPCRSYLRDQFDMWSDRTFATYYAADRMLAELREVGAISMDEHKALLSQAIRPNGTINVCKFARVASAELFRYADTLDAL